MSKLNVLYEDNHVIVVEKPINVLSQGDATGDKDLLTMVKEYVKIKYNKPGNVYVGLVHRLDRPVGGIMVFAKTSKSSKRMTEQIKSHKVEKKYLAVVNNLKNSEIVNLSYDVEIPGKLDYDLTEITKIIEQIKEKDCSQK